MPYKAKYQMVENSNLLNKVRQIEMVLYQVDSPGQLHRGSNLAWAIAKEAPNADIADLAYQVLMALNMAPAPDKDLQYIGALHSVVERLRFAITKHQPPD
jgi:hypothetical protein